MTITTDLQRSLVRDVLRTFFGGRSWVMLGAACGILIVFMLVKGLADSDAPSFFFAGGLALAAALFILLLRGSLGKAIRSAYPVGFAAEASLSGDGIVSTSALGVAEIRFTAFRGVVVTPSVVVLKMAVRSSGMAAIPRRLLSDRELERLQSEIARASAMRSAGRAPN